MENDYEIMLERVHKIIKESDKIVCVMGLDAAVECGGKDLWSSDNLYQIEKTYGMSPEEMLSTGEYATRKERFYDFYKKEILSELPTPGETYEALKVLQEKGKLSAIISMNIYGLEKLSGLDNVIELGGNIHHNYCPNCRRTYPVDYLLSSRAVPICEECKIAIRPNIRLMGERVQNDIYTQAALACSDAEVILVLGTNLYSSKVQYCTGHYTGNNLVLINPEEHFTDRHADCVLYGRCKDILPQLVKEL